MVRLCPRAYDFARVFLQRVGTALHGSFGDSYISVRAFAHPTRYSLPVSRMMELL
jgi:hypothetical protein